MSLNTGQRGDRLIVTNEKSPWHGKTVIVQEVLIGQDYKRQSRDGDTYKVYKCTDKDMNICMLSPTEVKRAEAPKRDFSFKMELLTPLGKMRTSTRQFRKEYGESNNSGSGDEWGLLVACFNLNGDFMGLKVGCQYIEKDAVQEILDRLGEIGYPMASADQMESAREG